MSANPTNANLSLTNLDLGTGSPESGLPQILPETRVSAPGHEALQALLAFSSLHEQIRHRRAREVRRGVRLGPDDVWELEQFVLDEVLQLVAERALAITGADGIAIALAEGDAIVCRASAGSNEPAARGRLDPKLRFLRACLPPGENFWCYVAGNDGWKRSIQRLQTRSESRASHGYRGVGAGSGGMVEYPAHLKADHSHYVGRGGPVCRTPANCTVRRD